MRVLAVAALALVLAGCDRAEAPAPTATDLPEAVSPPSPPASPALGTTSALTGQTSALTGQVTGFAVQVTDSATVVALAADTLFAFDKADLAPDAVENLRRTADIVAKGAAGTVKVTGYTDAKGEDAYNLDLSRRRAGAVVAWLKARPDLAGRPFTATGLGEADPVAPNARPDGSDDPEGRARNRRVVVEVPR